MNIYEFLHDFHVGIENGFGSVESIVKMYEALSAVAELHRPVISVQEDLYWCNHCPPKWEYPCPTIESLNKVVS